MPDDFNIYTKPDIHQLQNWVYEAQWAHKAWREQAWRSSELYDGGAASWTLQDWNEAKDSGINPLTINRTFPTINLILGYQILNAFDIMAKGRTQKDSEIAQVMTEGIKFISDQYSGEFLISQAFKDQVVPGFGAMQPMLNPDPRKEYLGVEAMDWKEVWWDPFSSPWWEPTRTRYVFLQRWMDLEALQVLFYSKRKEIQEQYTDFTYSNNRARSYSEFQDEGLFVEEYIRQMAGTDWTDARRKRVRPVQLWYPIPERCVFALFPDGRYAELKDSMPVMAQFQLISAAQEVVASIVRKMRCVTFFGDLVLQDVPTPFPHDEFPIIPFVGYLDRYGFPYGAPMQIEGMQEEVNKRRSMAVALLKARRVVAEKDSVIESSQTNLDAAYEEANKLDGFIVLAPGGLKKFKIVEGQELSPAQVKLMQDSEREIAEVSGPNFEMMGYESNATSGIAIEKRSRPGEIRITPLLSNLKRSSKMLGDQLISNIQGFWTGEKVLRITDRMTGAEKFVEVNKRIQGPQGEVFTKNNITQGKFDTVISDRPQTDTVKEKNIELFMTLIQKSPPEAIPILLSASLELMDLPNKEQLLAKIKPLLGGNPLEEDMSSEQIKQQIVEQMNQQKASAQQAEQIKQILIQLEMKAKDLQNKKLEVEIAALLNEQKLKRAEIVMDMKANILQFPQRKALPSGNETGRSAVRKEGGSGSKGTQASA